MIAERYIGFGFCKYYPRGGWEDFVGTFNDIEDAKRAIEAHTANYGPAYRCGNIVDTADNRILFYLDEDGWQEWSE